MQVKLQTYLLIKKMIVRQIKNVLLPQLSDLYSFLYILQTIECLRICPIQQRLEEYKSLIHIPYIYIYFLIHGILSKALCLLVSNTCTFTHYLYYYVIIKPRSQCPFWSIKRIILGNSSNRLYILYKNWKPTSRSSKHETSSIIY